ncbi:ABC transporter permease [uncultured Paracoccus sp.]|uniref:ABC transporter permease n=1 Tax=uncultured Paracoccus sp. TaxID=189685 RepID=UPI002636E50A|nr:ABC transporter permease [uncultured Paracoccus sp.]
MASHRRRLNAYFLSAPAAILIVAFLVTPILSTVLLSLREYSTYGGISDTISLLNYRDIFTDSYFAEVLLRTMKISLLVTLGALVLGVPEAYILYRMRSPWRNIFLLVVLGPLFISVVARTLGWALIFGSTGLISSTLQRFGLISQPFDLMYTETGVVIALIHVLVPYMVLSVWASLQRLDRRIESAAESLGASQITIIRRIVLPLALPGILAGSLIVFALAASAFATPAILGGRRLKVVATLAYDEFLNTLNWPLGAAVAILLLIFIAILMTVINKWIESKYSEVFK